MRYRFVPLLFVALFIAIASLPTWELPIQRAQNLTERQQIVAPIHRPPKIDYMSRVRHTVEQLNHSPRIMTIHHNENEKTHAIKREVTVKFKTIPNETALAEIKESIRGDVKKRLDHYWVFESKTKSGEEMIAYFNAREDVEYAEPNYILLPNEWPNDPLYTRYQWNLPMINAERGWEISRGNEEVIIAVIDTGVDLNHQDFKGQLVPGYNALNDSNDPSDDNGHGSHVAGIISASTNNRLGIAGVSWNNKIMPIKAIDADGTGTSFDIAKGVRWAVDHGAKVINMSVGNYHPSGVLLDSIRYAHNKGVVLVAASGNDNTNQPSYPAAYPEVISVAAVDPYAHRASFSNFGRHIDVAAPGVDIPSVYLNNEYAALSGTSMACPHVAGLAGLILSVAPELNNQEVREIIQSTAKKVEGDGRDDLYGHGIIDVSKALRTALNINETGNANELSRANGIERSWLERILSLLLGS